MSIDISERHKQTLAELLARASFGDDSVEVIEVAGESTNTVYFATLKSGRPLVLRVYGDSGWSEEYGRARLPKERYLHGLLADRGVAVPAILAGADEPDLQAVLMERLPGQPLGKALQGADEAEQDALWAVVGASLRAVHEISLAEVPGEIVGEHVVPFDRGGWGSFAMHEFVEDVERLSRFVPALKIDRGLLTEVAIGARRHLDTMPARLVHNDPSVDNVFVQRDEGGWRVAGWLDWEFARHGVPAWDCARIELFREASAAAPRSSFWRAYGALDEISLAANRLTVALFCASVQFEHHAPGSERHAPAIEWLGNFPQRMGELREILAQ